MSALFIILTVVQVFVCSILVGIILMQKKNAGLTGTLGGGMSGGNVPTYWDKNKSRSFEGKLANYTRICAGAFFIVTLILNFVK